jgi:hypothetical protein
MVGNEGWSHADLAGTIFHHQCGGRNRGRRRAILAKIAQRYLEARARIERRRRFMTVVIGIDLKPEIRPLTNIPA